MYIMPFRSMPNTVRMTRWAGSVLGRRASRTATAVLNDVILRGRVVGFPLIATDGFEYYGGVIERLFGSACVYGQVLKTRRNDRVVRVERRRRIGTAGRLKRPSFPRLSHPRLAQAIPSIACIAQVYLGGVGGFRDPAHLVRRASQPHDSPRLGVLAPPLMLVPVRCEREGRAGAARYRVAFDDEALDTNYSLFEKLKHSFDMTLPLLRDEHIPEDYWQEVDEAIESKKKEGWQVVPRDDDRSLSLPEAGHVARSPLCQHS